MSHSFMGGPRKQCQRDRESMHRKDPTKAANGIDFFHYCT